MADVIAHDRRWALRGGELSIDPPLAKSIGITPDWIAATKKTDQDIAFLLAYRNPTEFRLDTSTLTAAEKRAAHAQQVDFAFSAFKKRVQQREQRRAHHLTR